jgi:magnesium-transporting ATPase (P-type)
MDTMGALALATELPTPELLQRKPYKRSASLISWPMWRNIWTQAIFQMILLLVLLFEGSNLFNVAEEGPTFTAQGTDYACMHYDVGGKSGSNSKKWDINTGLESASGTITCSTYKSFCNSDDRTSDRYRGDKGKSITKNFNDNDFYTDSCFNKEWTYEDGTVFKFSNMVGFQKQCLDAEDYCLADDFTKSTIIFNAFIFAQLFNEYNARVLGDKLNCFEGIETNPIFIGVTIFSIGCQIMLVEVGGAWVSTSPLSLYQWLITIALGAISVPVGVLMRFIPVKENPDTFFDSSAAQMEKIEEQEIVKDAGDM